jgi:hypothetical protein
MSDALAIVTIRFSGKAPDETQMQRLESVLREDPNVGSLSALGDEMEFHLWGKDTIDYRTLDRLKDELKKISGLKFSLKADEYKKSGDRSWS